MKLVMGVLIILLVATIGITYAESPQVPDCYSFGTSAANPMAGNTEVRLRRDAIIGGTVVGDTLFYFENRVVKFPIEFVNRDTVVYVGINGFRVYSSDGATWGHPTGDGGNYHGFTPDVFGVWIDTTGYYPKNDFGGLYRFQAFGADGAGVDSVVWIGIAVDPSEQGIRPLDSGIHFYIIIRPKLADIGKHICIDSITNCPPTCQAWRWSSFNYQPSYASWPTWNGPYCFVLGGCCRGLTGNYDCDPDDLCDISDVTKFIERYTTIEPAQCPGEANIDGSPDGNSDISDLTALIDYLYISFTPPAPCRYPN